MPININEEINYGKVYRVNDDLVMKTEEFRDNDDLQHEYEIGLQTNDWQLPNFVNTVALIQGCAAGENNNSSKRQSITACSFSYEDCNQNYLITSLVKQAKSLADINDDSIVTDVVVQVILLLHYLNHRYGFTHYDLHWGNILVVDLMTKHRLVYPAYDTVNNLNGNQTGYTISTRYLPVIIDYGRAYTDKVGGVKDNITRVAVIANSVDVTKSCLLHDIIYILYSSGDCHLNSLRELYGLPATVDHSHDTEEQYFERQKDFIFGRLLPMRDKLLKVDGLTQLQQSPSTLSMLQLSQSDLQLQLQTICPGLFAFDESVPIYQSASTDHSSQSLSDQAWNDSNCNSVYSIPVKQPADIPDDYLFNQRMRKYYRTCLKLVVALWLHDGFEDDNIKQLRQLLTDLGSRLQEQQLQIQQSGNFSICDCYNCNKEHNRYKNNDRTHLLNRVDYTACHNNLDWLVKDYGQQIRQLQKLHQAGDDDALTKLFELFNDFGTTHWMKCELKMRELRHQLDISLFIDFFYIVCSSQISRHTTASICGNDQLISTTPNYYGLQCFSTEYDEY